jgi:hypothetical protein
MLGAGYTLLGSAFDKLGDSSRAIADLKLALSLFEQTLGRNSLTYSQAEVTYARVLHNSGSKQRQPGWTKRQRMAWRRFAGSSATAVLLAQQASGEDGNGAIAGR